jgi:hypothetical protein
MARHARARSEKPGTGWPVQQGEGKTNRECAKCGASPAAAINREPKTLHPAEKTGLL